MIPSFFREILSGFGVVLYRALIPLFTCICVAARAGTAVTAYLSSMREPQHRQWDAMRSFGVEPYAFFLPQLIICFCVGCVVLSYLSFLCASLGSLLISLATNPLCTRYTWFDTYWAGLKTSYGMFPQGSVFFILKTGLSGLCIALVSVYYGGRPKATTLETMRLLGRSNVMSVLITLIIFFSVLVWEQN